VAGCLPACLYGVTWPPISTPSSSKPLT
jgi:hypothetical protein